MICTWHCWLVIYKCYWSILLNLYYFLFWFVLLNLCYFSFWSVLLNLHHFYFLTIIHHFLLISFIYFKTLLISFIQFIFSLHLLSLSLEQVISSLMQIKEDRVIYFLILNKLIPTQWERSFFFLIKSVIYKWEKCVDEIEDNINVIMRLQQIRCDKLK